MIANEKTEGQCISRWGPSRVIRVYSFRNPAYKHVRTLNLRNCCCRSQGTCHARMLGIPRVFPVSRSPRSSCCLARSAQLARKQRLILSSDEGQYLDTLESLTAWERTLHASVVTGCL